MNVLDIVAIIMALIAIIVGCHRGFIKSVGVVVGLVCSILAAKAFSYVVSPWIAKPLSQADPKVIEVLSFVIVLVGVYLICYALIRLLDHFVQAVFLGWLNRVLGGILSLVICLFVISIALNVYEFFDKDQTLIGKALIEDSITYTHILHFAPSLWPMLDIKTWHIPEIEDIQEAILPS